MLKNITVFRLEGATMVPPAVIDEILQNHPAGPPLPTQFDRLGWSPPEPSGETLVEGMNPCVISACQWSRVLPPGVITLELNQWIRAYEKQNGYRPGLRLRTERKEAIVLKLLPQAFTQEKQVRIIIDQAKGLLFVGSTSDGEVTSITNAIRDHLMANAHGTGGSLCYHGVDNLARHMSSWILDGEAPAPFQIGSKATLEHAGETQESIRYAGRRPVDKAAKDYIAGGFRCTQLELLWKDRMCFTLNAMSQLKSVTPLDFMKADKGEEETPSAQLAADAALLSGALVELLSDLAMVTGDAGETSQQEINMASGHDVDPAFDDAVQLVKQHQRLSISWIQRMLKIGYNRAARIVEEMEDRKLISPPDDEFKREVII